MFVCFISLFINWTRPGVNKVKPKHIMRCYPECVPSWAGTGADPGASLVTTVASDLPHADLKGENNNIYVNKTKPALLNIRQHDFRRGHITLVKLVGAFIYHHVYRSLDRALGHLRVPSSEPGDSARSAALPFLWISYLNSKYNEGGHWGGCITWGRTTHFSALPDICKLSTSLTLEPVPSNLKI